MTLAQVVSGGRHLDKRMRGKVQVIFLAFRQNFTGCGLKCRLRRQGSSPVQEPVRVLQRIAVNEAKNFGNAKRLEAIYPVRNAVRI